MEALKFSKSNRSNLKPKNLLVLSIRSVELGRASEVGRDDEVAVCIQSGRFSLRTSYLKADGTKVNINEKVVIDLDNHKDQSLSFYVQKIPKNTLNQVQKDGCDEEIVSEATCRTDMWTDSTRAVRIETYDEDRPTDIIINVDARKIHATPDRDTMPALLEGGVILLGRDVLYKDMAPVKYPPNEYLFDVWG